MQNRIEIEAGNTFPLLPMEKNQDGKYPVPAMRCGVLPFYVGNNNQILWGCIESDRVGPVIVAPAAGIQDIIVVKGETCLRLEVGKPFPELEFDFLKPFAKTMFRDEAFQTIITSFVENQFEVYVENPLDTALHETEEEHGVDLQAEGKHRHLLHTLLELPVRELNGKQGASAQYTCIAYMGNCDDVELRHTNKIETKIRRNMYRSFYEKGCWGTLDSFKQTLLSEQQKFNSPEEQKRYTTPQLDLVKITLSANQDTIDYLESIELSLRSDKLKLATILVGDGLTNLDFTKRTVSNLVAQSLFRIVEEKTSESKQAYHFEI